MHPFARMHDNASEGELDLLLAEIADYQVTHASLLKSPRLQVQLDSPVALAFPIGVSVFPSPFPRGLFKHAVDLQVPYNTLYMRVADDHKWLGKVLATLFEHDDFARKLWDIWVQVRAEGEVQPLRLVEHCSMAKTS